MAKYWKLSGALLVVGVLAAVMVAAVPAAMDSQGGNEPQLFTLLSEVKVPSGSELVGIESEYVDVSKFSDFRVFTRIHTDPTTIPVERIIITFVESVDGVVEAVPRGLTPDRYAPLITGFLSPPHDEVFEFTIKPRRYVKVVVTSNSSRDIHSLSVFLHAAP